MTVPRCVVAPSEVRELDFIENSIGSDQVGLTWKAPGQPNGIIAYYVITAKTAINDSCVSAHILECVPCQVSKISSQPVIPQSAALYKFYTQTSLFKW